MDRCLAFCQALATSNQRFSLNLTIGKDNFSFENKELATSSWQKKKKSPSQLRREVKRREERKMKAAEEVTDPSKSPAKVIVTVSDKEEDITVTLTDQAEDVLNFKCDQCDYNSISEKGLRQHVRMKHRISQIDGADDSENESNLESKGTEKTHISENLGTIDLDCFNLLGITEKCMISCNQKFPTKEDCYKHMYVSTSKCCQKLRSNMEKSGFAEDIKKVGFQKVMLNHTLSQIM